MRVFAASLSFVLGLVFGIGSVLISDSPGEVFFVKPPAIGTSLRAENLIGTWTGNWGHNDGDCTIEIERVSGNTFFGTLRKGGAVIKFVGNFEPNSRRIFFEETEVQKIGANMGKWSLGTNRGRVSYDGRILTGSGYDEWGNYGWAASR